ncbi:MAG: isoprenylcysteine carboxylmethyltransferase family protein [Gemmatimonadota bacterium]
MVALGNFLFRHRNKLFPVFYLLLFVPSPDVTERFRLMLGLGFAVSILGQVIRIGTVGLKYIVRGGWDRRVYAEKLVTEGIFAHCRNPLYVGNLLTLAGLGIMSNSLVFNLVATPLFIFMYQAIVRAEEAFLREEFGEAYERYTEDVNRWVPNPRGLGETLSSMEFNWVRVLVKEYTTVYIWLTGAVVVTMEVFATRADARVFRMHWEWGAIALVALFVLYVSVMTLKRQRVLRA